MLTLLEPDIDVWQRFRSGELDERDYDGHPVLTRWRRTPVGDPDFVTTDELAQRRTRAAGVLARSALLEDVGAELRRRGCALLLADEGGVIVASIGTEVLPENVARAVSEGTRWSEGARGTNAIGVALTEQTAVAVMGRAHYDVGGHGLACYAAPLRGENGRIIGVLDATVPIEKADPLLGVTVQALAALLESEFSKLGARSHRAREMRLPEEPFVRIVGSDPMLVDACQRAAQFAPSPLPILLLAETGTGKELMARAIHRSSDRARGPFVVVNCGAMPETLLASELFGYAPGAFTGARESGNGGRIGAAQGGTLFLDEIAEMSPALQAMLLRVLEDGSYSRVGEPRERRSDFRLVSATCRDLPKLVREGTFRKDLFYRIQGVTLNLPAVRARADVKELATSLFADLAAELGLRKGSASLHASAVDEIGRRPWPGNVRELKMALQYALVASAGRAGSMPSSRVVRAEHLPPLQGALEITTTAKEPSSGLRDAEHDALRKALARAGGNMAQAARELGVARSTLYRMLKKHGLGAFARD